jgi:xylan 1,4-beta-xylosidase
MQQYDHEQRRLVGERTKIFEGTSLGFTEAPHLYQRGGYYYLLTAEGGTGFGHAATLARSRTLIGPYELHPDVHILSARDRPDAVLQRAGHADLVETQTGDPYLVYLCGRPLPNRGRCTLGRETALQPMRWGDDGWLYTLDGTGAPQHEFARPDLAEHPFSPPPVVETFDSGVLPLCFQWLRSPWPDELFSLSERPGYLRLFGQESIGSPFRQALVARRIESHCISVSTRVEFEPEHYQQMAGLVCYYNASKYHYLLISSDEQLGKSLQVLSCSPDRAAADAVTDPVALPPGSSIGLRVEIDFERLRFAYRVGNGAWCWLDTVFDASVLSDEAARPGSPNFTGAFVGMACQDMAGTARPADFAHFSYRDRPFIVDPLEALPDEPE